MGSSLFYWRKTIAGVMLFGMMFYALIPLAGMTGHRLLPPHEHFLVGDAALRHHDDAEFAVSVQSVDLFCGVEPSSVSEEKILHSASEASGMFANAPAFACDSVPTLVLFRTVVAQLVHEMPPTTVVLFDPLHLPPI